LYESLTETEIPKFSMARVFRLSKFGCYFEYL